MKCFIFITTFILYHIQQANAKLNDDDILKIAQQNDQLHYEKVLKNLLQPRVVGTSGWKNVQNFIIKEMTDMGMQVEVDKFNNKTPIFGDMEFVNIIGKLNPNADQFLTLACHYDSKYFENNIFEGATDSSVPCSLMLNVVYTTLPTISEILNGKNYGLMLLFLDGEEAFENWSPNDSLYGSRHLANKWSQQSYKNAREIDRINVFVLLDLIGATNTRFKCSFRNTCLLNKRLREIESKLSTFRALTSVSGGPATMFLNGYRQSAVDDDHVPFMNQGIPILHLIPERFPNVWHTNQDNGKNINHKAVANFNRVLRVFVVEQLVQCSNNLKSCNYRTGFFG